MHLACQKRIPEDGDVAHIMLLKGLHKGCHKLMDFRLFHSVPEARDEHDLLGHVLLLQLRPHLDSFVQNVCCHRYRINEVALALPTCHLPRL